jgi:hypothetical protein
LPQALSKNQTSKSGGNVGRFSAWGLHSIRSRLSTESANEMPPPEKTIMAISAEPQRKHVKAGILLQGTICNFIS